MLNILYCFSIFFINELKIICKDCIINFLAHILKKCIPKKDCFYIYFKFDSSKTINTKIEVS